MSTQESKLAKDSKDKKDQKGFLGGAAAAVGGTVAGLGANLGNVAMYNRASQSGLVEQALAEHANLYKSLENASPVPVKEIYAHNFFMPNATSKGNAFINMPKQGPLRSAGALAHEIGHADIDSKRVGGLLQIGSILAHKGVHSLGPLAGLGIGAFTDSGWGGAALSAGIPIAAMTPSLIAEIVATRKGMNRLKALGASPEAIAAASKTLRNAFGTYGTQTAGYAAGSLASYGLGRLARRGYQRLSDLDSAPIKQAYLTATGDGSFDQEKMAGWLTDTISKAKSYIAPSAVGKIVAPTSGALKATGTMKQMQAGRNFGGATVDPFVKMRKAMMSPVGAAA